MTDNKLHAASPEAGPAPSPLLSLSFCPACDDVDRQSAVENRLEAGTYFAVPLIVEAGVATCVAGENGAGTEVDAGIERRVSIVLQAGAKLHATAFVFATPDDASCAPRSFEVSHLPTADSATHHTARLSLNVELAGEGAEFHLHCLYVVSGKGQSAGKAHIDVKVNHLAPDCVSRQLVKGIAADDATGTFAGLVHVAQGARGTDASQRNQNLQLTDTAHVFTRPQLEIYADDVKCSHGATVGRLDEEAVYYMRQRGVSEAEARRMQMQGFAEEIVNHCPSETLRDSLSRKISGLLNRF